MQLFVIQIVAFFVMVPYTVPYTVILLGTPFFIILGLNPLNDDELMFPYRKARLADRNGDLNKKWYINYYVYDVQQKSLVRRQYYDINKFKTAEQRRIAAERVVKQVNELLSKGYHIDRSKAKEEMKIESMALIQAVRYAMNIIEKKVAYSTWLSYSSVFNDFIDFIEVRGDDNIPVNTFSRKMAIFYIDYLVSEKGIAGNTTNKYRDYLKALFSILVEREIIDKNPWKGIKKEKGIRSRQNLAFRKDEMKLVLQKLKYTDTELLSFVQIMFYTFMRPKEIRLTKVSNVLLEDQKIIIYDMVSKNRSRGFVEIPPQLTSVLEALIQQKSPGEYLFQGTSGKPYGKNAMSMRHREILKELNLDDEHTLYSWKHTGVVNAYNAGVKMKAIQLQCRHYSIAQTDEYLKSLGLFDNKEIRLGMPDLPL